MKNIFLTVCSLLIFTAIATAQNVQKDVQKHELSIYGLGGYSSVGYTLDGNGSKSNSIGGGAGLGYTFNINPSLGIVTGVEMTMYSSEASYDRLSKEYTTGTGEDLLRFTYSVNNYKEAQSIRLFSIPLMAQYSLPLGGGSTRFFASGGFKLGFPVTAKADITPGTATTLGYYAHEDITYVNLPQHGFVNNAKLPDVSRDIDLGFSASLALETGVRFALTDKIGLYTGLYFDYGLNSIQKVNDRHLLEYDVANESSFRYSSVLNTVLTDKVNLLSIGLKLRISLRL